MEQPEIPVFEKTTAALESGLLTKAHRSNNEYTQAKILFSQEMTDLQKLIYFDPQTSGGLLLSVESSKADILVQKLKDHFPGTAIVGEVLDKKDLHVVVG